MDKVSKFLIAAVLYESFKCAAVFPVSIIGEFCKYSKFRSIRINHKSKERETMATIKMNGQEVMLLCNMGYDYDGKKIKPTAKSVIVPDDVIHAVWLGCP